jgi:integrase
VAVSLSTERPVLTVPQVYALADAVPDRYRALVLLTVFGSLRWGELAALRRSDIDFQARTVRISRQLSEQRGGFTFGPPKSDVGYRTVAIPAVITPDLASHIVTLAAPGDDGLVFTSSEGKPLRRSNFCRRVWHPALRAAGLPAIHFHDLRHTGNQFASSDEGANLRELMDRMGHSTTPAAMAYLHGSDERQQVIADALSSRAAAELNRPETRPSGTQRARQQGRAS